VCDVYQGKNNIDHDSMQHKSSSTISETFQNCLILYDRLIDRENHNCTKERSLS